MIAKWLSKSHSPYSLPVKMRWRTLHEKAPRNFSGLSLSVGACFPTPPAPTRGGVGMVLRPHAAHTTEPKTRTGMRGEHPCPIFCLCGKLGRLRFRAGSWRVSRLVQEGVHFDAGPWPPLRRVANSSRFGGLDGGKLTAQEPNRGPNVTVNLFPSSPVSSPTRLPSLRIIRHGGLCSEPGFSADLPRTFAPSPLLRCGLVLR